MPPSAPRPAPRKPDPRITSAERPNTLGLAARDLAHVLDKIDANDGGKTPVRRGFARWPFRQATVWVTIMQPGGSEVRLKLAGRNLSRGGMSLLHNAYMHPGSTLVVTLPCAAGGAVEMGGTVKRCQHRRGTMHELGVQFDQELDLSDFIGGNDVYSLEHVQPEKITAVILYAEENEVDVRIMQHFLGDTQARLQRVKSGAETLQQAGAGADLIILGAPLNDMSAADCVARLRSAAVHTPVIILASVSDAAKAGSPGSGVTVLHRPLQQVPLLRAIAERTLVKAGSGVSCEGQGAATPPISDAVIMQYFTIADTLEKALTAEDTPGLTEACAQVRSTAPAVGLAALSRASEQALSALSAADATQRTRCVRDLIAACRSLNRAA